jgi:hypothetical protein
MSLLEDAAFILAALGVPVAELTPTRRNHVCRAFVGLAGLKPGDSWLKAQDYTTRTLTTKQLLGFNRQHHGEKRSDGSYDDVRREDLKLQVAAGIVQAAANKAHANTNDATRGFGIHPEAARVARTLGTVEWASACDTFSATWPSLAEELARKRVVRRIPINVKAGVEILFEPDAHNVLQKAIIEHFLPIFGNGADVLYVGDAADKGKFIDEDGLRAIGVFEMGHEKLPDVVAYSSSKNWLFLIESVTTANPVTEIRRLTLERLLQPTCLAGRIYISAFPDRSTFRKFAAEIAWETEVWIAEYPDHMAHFNGDKFMGPHGSCQPAKIEGVIGVEGSEPT